MTTPERTYRMLLRAYPPAFRRAYGRDMAQLFRDQLHDARQPGARFWTAVLWDVARSAPALRLAALREHRRRAWTPGPRGGGPHHQPEDGTMSAKRTVAMLAVLGGAFEVVNAGADVWAGGSAPRGGGWMLAVALAALAGVLLAAGGVGLLRRDPGGARLARGGALACLALVVTLQLTFPFLSIFSRLLGIGLPLALLLVARRPSGDTSMPSAA